MLWRGSKFLPGVVDTLKELQQLGKKIIFCTNNSTKPRQHYVEKFKKVDISIEKSSVYTSSSTAASYLASLPSHTFDKSKDKAFIIGFKGLLAELNDREIQTVFSDDLIAQYPNIDMHALSELPLDPSFKAVIVGLDPNMSYTKGAFACMLLRQIEDSSDVVNPEYKCIYISTNQDKTFPASHGRLLPGAGSCVAMVNASSGRVPMNMGKPASHMMDMVVKEHDIDLSRTLMVGDRLDTDVVFGNRMGT